MSKRNHILQSIWNISDLLRDDYPTYNYEKIILPLVVLRRFDFVLQETKKSVLDVYSMYENTFKCDNLDSILCDASGQEFYNSSPLDFMKLMEDPKNIHINLNAYINGFSENAKQIFMQFNFNKEIERMQDNNILFIIMSSFSDINLSPNNVNHMEMGYIFRDLIRRFNELSSEINGEYITPPDIVKTMVSLLFKDNHNLSYNNNTSKEILDPTCGTGSMLIESINYLNNNYLNSKVNIFGQDSNPRSFAIASASTLMSRDPNKYYTSTIKLGDTLVNDQFKNKTFDYFISNPPFGISWNRQKEEILNESKSLGMNGRFGAGTPRLSDGSMLFLQHMINKFKPFNPYNNQFGSKLAILFNGSPLFTGNAGSGESEIRKWIIENDLLEAVVALPEHLFYNTSIGTYIWIITNRKNISRKGKIQLIDAREKGELLRRSLGSKRRELSEENIDSIIEEYSKFTETTTSKIFDNSDFGYQRITINQPLRLKFNMNFKLKEQFLDNYPKLINDIQTIENKIFEKNISYSNWNEILKEILVLIKKNHSNWNSAQIKSFRNIFTEIDQKSDPVILKSDNNKLVYESNPKLQDYENIPLKEKNIDNYFNREVLPNSPYSWIDKKKTKIGYEINFNIYFYKVKQFRSLEAINEELKIAENKILQLLSEITE